MKELLDVLKLFLSLFLVQYCIVFVLKLIFGENVIMVIQFLAQLSIVAMALIPVFVIIYCNIHHEDL